jgi:hypothetical protein
MGGERTSTSGAEVCWRTLHALDVENELVTGLEPDNVIAVGRAYLAAARCCPGDLMVVGSSQHCWQCALFIRPQQDKCSWVVRDGADGVELAVLGALHCHRFWNFDRLVIASADHRFTELAARVAAMGLQVAVVRRRGCLSRELRAACNQFTYLADTACERAA